MRFIQKLPSCRKSDQKLINQLITNRNWLIILNLFIDMGARGNKLSSCKIADQYLKKQKSY